MPTIATATTQGIIKRENMVLVSEEDWQGVQEIFYLRSIPGMMESLQRRVGDSC